MPIRPETSDAAIARRKIQKNWRRSSPVKFKASLVRYRRKLRQDVIDKYGGECVCCGETQFEFLTMDHIDGRGVTHKHRADPGSWYREMRDRPADSTKYRILCWNCNCAIGAFGFCPHSVSK